MSETQTDTLLEALVFFGRLHSLPVNRQGAVQGLPLVHGCLTPELFARAATRCGLESRMVHRTLGKLHGATLPAILLLKDSNAAVIVTSITGDEAEVVNLSNHGSVHRLPLAKLRSAYSGIAIFVKPAYQFEKRSDFNPRALGNNWFWGTLWKYRSFYARVGLASLVINILALASSLFVMNVYDRVVPNQAVDTLFVLALGVGVAYLFEFLLKSVRTYFVDRAGQRIDMILGSEIFGRILGMRFEDRPTSAGSLSSQARSYEALREFFTSATVAALVDLPFVLLFAGVIYLLAGMTVALPLVVGIILALFIGAVMQLPISRAVRDSYQSANQRQALVVEGIQAIETIKATRCESQMQARLEDSVRTASKAEVKSRGYAHLAMNLTSLIQHLVSTAIIIFAFFEVTKGNLSMGAMIAAVILSGRAMAPMALVASLLTRLQQSRRSLVGLNQIMDMPMEREERTAQYISVTNFTPDIRIHDLGYRYDEEGEDVIDNVSLEIAAGERVAILGRIGSGKSTLLRMLMGFYGPKRGRIDISGIDIRQFDPAELRSHIGYVPQDPALLYGTLRSNLTAGCPWVEDVDLIEALRIAGLGEFVKKQPRGIDQPVAEGGRSLSGGQRQSLALARAVIEEPSLLVLDEPTSHRHAVPCAPGQKVRAVTVCRGRPSPAVQGDGQPGRGAGQAGR